MTPNDDALRARVEQAQALAAATTPGPWRSEGDTMTGGMDFRYVMVPLPVGTSVASGIIARCQRFGTHAHESAANADLMAAAPDLAALVADLWAEVERLTAAVADNHKAIDYYGDVAERAETERSNARDELLRMTAERDAALAEVERLRAVAQPVVSERPALRWKLSLIGTWALCLQPGDWLSGAYIAFHHGAAMAYAADGAAFGRSERLANLEAAVSRIATWAREDGYHVPPHPLGWDIGEAPRA